MLKSALRSPEEESGMAGMAAKVVVTERQFAILGEFRQSRSEPGWVVQRAAVIVLAFEKWSNQKLAAEVSLDRMAVGLWRWRWQAAWDELTVWECAEPQRLREAIRETLRDAPRSGCPGTFTAEQVTQILAVACEPPETRFNALFGVWG